MARNAIDERAAKWMWKATRDQEILASQIKERASERYSKLLANVAGADGVQYVSYTWLLIKYKKENMFFFSSNVFSSFLSQ